MLVCFFLNSDYFERNYFFNEIFSFIGLVLFLCKSLFLKKVKIDFKSYDFFVFMFLLLCLGYLIFSIPYKTNWYFYARNSVIFYSVFAFYFGVAFFDSFEEIINRIRVFFKLFISYSVIFQKTFLARYSGPILFPLFFKYFDKKKLLLLVLLIITHAILHDALSISISAIFLIIFWILPNYKSGVGFLFLCITSLTVFYFYFLDNILLYKTGDYNYFGNYLAVYNSHPFLSIDNNTSWRLILWFRFLVERFPENFLGIGFGTPMLPYKPFLQTASMDTDEVHAHVSGSHNTFVTLFLRLGLIGFILIANICSKVFKDFFKMKEKMPNSIYLKYYFIWFSLFTIGLFNLCIETPLRASLFWISLGFVSRIKTLSNQL